MNQSRFTVRFVLAAAMLIATGGILHARQNLERIPEYRKLTTFPQQLNAWSGRDTVIGAAILELLGPGDFLSRIYRAPAERSPIQLFIAFFPSQRQGDTV